MKKNHGKVTFKRYSQEQAMLLPPSLEELIPPEHLVRMFNGVVNEVDIRRFMIRGLEKTKTEWGLLCFAHNIKKLAVQ